jgi:hypothetical protein
MSPGGPVWLPSWAGLAELGSSITPTTVFQLCLHFTGSGSEVNNRVPYCTSHHSNLSVSHLKSNSWKYNNFVEVSGHNLESSQTWGFRIESLQNQPVSNHFCSGGGGDKNLLVEVMWIARNYVQESGLRGKHRGEKRMDKCAKGGGG